MIPRCLTPSSLLNSLRYFGMSIFDGIPKKNLRQGGFQGAETVGIKPPVSSRRFDLQTYAPHHNLLIEDAHIMICFWIWFGICIYVNIYIYIYLCTCIYIYIYIFCVACIDTHIHSYMLLYNIYIYICYRYFNMLLWDVMFQTLRYDMLGNWPSSVLSMLCECLEAPEEN